MKSIWISLTVLLLALPNLSFTTTVEKTSTIGIDNNSINLSAFEVRQRLDQLGGLVDLKYTTDVEKNIKYYLGRRKKNLSRIIGKSEMYFPIFEHYLLVNNLPDELKYLSVIESALNPKAISSAGAGGLWQFMRRTGLKQGLKIGSYIDERNDPIKSTEAAFDYLNELYNRYDDWTLALAAYNCGPGRVNRAIKQARTMDYWKLRRYLPAETRNYVPAFIAAAYVMNYYHNHEIQATPAKYKFEDLKTISVYESNSFYEIARISEVNYHEVVELNPAYKKNFIPRAENGNYLTLPIEGMMKFKDVKRQSKLNRFYNSNQSNYNEYMNIPESMIQSNYIVQKGESIDYVASLLKCTKEDLVRWNKMKRASVFVGQELVVFFKKKNSNSSKTYKSTPVSTKQNNEKVEYKRVLYHYIQRGETLGQINHYYPDVTLSDIIRLNNLVGEIKLVPGEKLKIKEL